MKVDIGVSFSFILMFIFMFIGGWWCKPTGKLFRFVRACRACRACGRGEAKLREGAGGVFGLTLGVAR